jgi:FixJ family two-component response regulator/GGDEF domain-containing protein
LPVGEAFIASVWPTDSALGESRVMGKARILAVDDQRYFRELTEGLLGDAGYEVRTASSGEEALRILEREDFDVILTDLVMPGIDGSELIGKIKERRPDQDIVMVTGVVDVKIAVNAMKQGAVDYVLKPFDREILVESIEKILSQRRLRNEHARLVEENLEFMGVLSLFERAAGFFGTLAIEPLAERLIEALCFETRAQSAVLWATDKPGGRILNLVGARGLVRIDGEPKSVGLDDFISAWCPGLESARSVVTTMPEDANAVEALYVPIRVGDVTLGVARLTDKLDGERFTAPDLVMAEKVSELGAIALKNAMRFRTLERLALRDPETQAYSLAYFEDAVRNEIQKANRFSHRFSILRVELEANGNVAPDSLELARTVTGALRTTDLLALNEDGVFFVLLPQTDALGAAILAERIRGSWLGLHKGERGGRIAMLQSVSVSYPADGLLIETLMPLLEERVADSRRGLLATRSDLREIRALDPLFDRLLEQSDVQPVEIEGQLLRFVLEDVFRRPGDRGVLILSPGATWLPEVLETLHETLGRDTQTEIVILADGAARHDNPQLTWISKSSLDDRRSFLVYYGEGPAFAMIGSTTHVDGSAPVFQTTDRSLVEYLAFELQRVLGILISV